jgi:hypothetical protein
LKFGEQTFTCGVMDRLKLSESMATTLLSSYDSAFFELFAPSAFARPTARQVFAACRAVGLAEEGLSLPFVFPLRLCVRFSVLSVLMGDPWVFRSVFFAFFALFCGYSFHVENS